MRYLVVVIYDQFEQSVYEFRREDEARERYTEELQKGMGYTVYLAQVIE